MAVNNERAGSTPLIETRSIDFIPEAERHGSLYSQFTLWLGANLQITAIVTGALAVVLGGDVFWSLIGLLIGQVLGGAVVALHAAQGPKLGLPQMISSRVQFGVYGAAIPIVLVCLMYLGFSATGAVLSGQAIAPVDRCQRQRRHPDFRRVHRVSDDLRLSGDPPGRPGGQRAGHHRVRLPVHPVDDPQRHRPAAGKSSFRLEHLPAGGVAVGVLADRFRPLRGGLLTLPAEQDLILENLRRRRPGHGAGRPGFDGAGGVRRRTGRGEFPLGTKWRPSSAWAVPV